MYVKYLFNLTHLVSYVRDHVLTQVNNLPLNNQVPSGSNYANQPYITPFLFCRSIKYNLGYFFYLVL